MVSLSLFPRLLVAQDLDVRSLVGEDWYGLYLNGQKAGYSINSVSVDENEQAAVSEDAHFRVKMSGQHQDMRICMRRLYAKDGSLIRIDQRIDDPGGAKQFEAWVDNGVFRLKSTVGGLVKESELPKPRESLKDALKQVELTGPNAKIGDSVSFSMFEPMYEREIDGTSRIESIEERMFEGAPTTVYRIKSVMPDLGIESDTYVAADGRTLEDRIGGIITMRLEPREMAQDIDYSNDVIVSNAAQADRRVENPRTRDSLRLRIMGPLAENHLFNDGRQRMAMKEGFVAFESKRSDPSSFRGTPRPVGEASVQEWLKPTLLVQSGDPRLIAKAHEIIGDERDAFVAGEALCHWVYKYVKTTYSARLSNALEVLDDPQGDCTEHSILFVGLARAAGIPAREVAGLIYVNEGEPAFYFHQWAMIWAGQWVDVDPTFDQPVADVTHVKLAEGDLYQQAKLIPVIGRLKIAVEPEEENDTP
ncbi:MAG TPA: transglutaminase-like domain-containing protein [Candidatus Hydrogenedentes bacterium]|nr:transglutaminase-like domain-containing protein [Candidatus Hydrogenedentota bacterium]HOV75270.1 transglutaminase-like domain-containing protein [Candidatus Hydrogenedentota bacterium]HPC17046.1 transglutaminase-like domain-containing protein [Candidatus Hydrogenedentota bacterium]HRT21004.1 transglutaminase-like domain-containing protein [Candidatus Hydrogenedentota bacterium]HRT65833.1 transglutaminase-like domain-containing protein [Candidatus Hydrogenedentota bacterium]